MIESTATFLADFGVTATFSAPAEAWSFDGTAPTFDSKASTIDGTRVLTFSASVIFDQPDSDVLGGRAHSTQYSIVFRTADLPGFAFNMAVTVNGAAYICREPPETLDDGVFSRALLEV